jgi:hypothetical protein
LWVFQILHQVRTDQFVNVGLQHAVVIESRAWGTCSKVSGPKVPHRWHKPFGIMWAAMQRSAGAQACATDGKWTEARPRRSCGGAGGSAASVSIGFRTPNDSSNPVGRARFNDLASSVGYDPPSRKHHGSIDHLCDVRGRYRPLLGPTMVFGRRPNLDLTHQSHADADQHARLRRDRVGRHSGAGVWPNGLPARTPLDRLQ